MLHTTFHGNQLTSPGEEDFLKGLPYMGVAAILVNNILTHFYCLVP